RGVIGIASIEVPWGTLDRIASNKYLRGTDGSVDVQVIIGAQGSDPNISSGRKNVLSMGNGTNEHETDYGKAKVIFHIGRVAWFLKLNFSQRSYSYSLSSNERLSKLSDSTFIPFCNSNTIWLSEISPPLTPVWLVGVLKKMTVLAISMDRSKLPTYRPGDCRTQTISISKLLSTTVPTGSSVPVWLNNVA